MEDTKPQQQKEEEAKLKQENPSRKSYSSTTSSPSASPSREFSFTISLNPSSAGSHKTNSFAIDLSPADEIFFHGHLLPLHLISRLPTNSPNPSTNSLDTFNFVIQDVSEDHEHTSTTNTTNTKGRIKMKSISTFWSAKWRKASEVAENQDDKKKKKTNKVKFELTQLFKRYLRMVKPNFFHNSKREKRQLGRRTCSFICPKEKQQKEGRRGGISAPATMQTSPTNSGNLSTTDNFPMKSDGSFEELHSAIQAAIAHCKNSTADGNVILH